MRGSSSSSGWSHWIRVVTLVALPGLSVTAFADEITVKGVVLRGTIVNITSGGVEFATDLGSGNITIPFENIEAISSDGPLHVIHGDEAETKGRILGVEDGELLVGDDADSATRVSTSDILEIDTPEEMTHWYERVRNKYRYWTASLDVGIQYQNSTSEETDFLVGFKMTRKKGPTTFVAKSSYIYGRNRTKGNDSAVSDNELLGLVRGEYDFKASRWFGFASNDFEYDEVDKISLRWVAKAGPGYRFLTGDKFKLNGDIGPAFVYKRFFGGDEEENAAIAFGIDGTWALPFGSKLSFEGDYLPAVDDWQEDYLLRGSIGLEYPLSDYLSFKTTIIDVYDNTPDDNTSRNELRYLASIAWRF